MKKIVTIFLFLIFNNIMCFADDTSDVKNFFNCYVNAANSYDTDYFKFYSKNAKIIRVVEKDDGTTQSVNIPLSRYKAEAKKASVFAKLRNYKNKYFDIKISKFGDDYILSANRMPSTSDYKIPAQFIIGKNKDGNWEIKAESMNTKVQQFLYEN